MSINEVASIKDVAKIAGVSTSTVSRVINNSSRVSVDMTKRVREVIGKTGYVPPPPDRRQGRRRVTPRPDKMALFALVLPETRAVYYPTLLSSFSRAASESGHQVIICESENRVERQADIFMQLMDKGVAGVALVPATIGPPSVHQVRQLQKQGVPLVMLHRGVDGVSAPVIELPFERIAELAAVKLMDAGHRRIGSLIGHSSVGTIRYVDGLRRAVEKRGLQMPDAVTKSGFTVIGDELGQNDASMEAELRDLLSLPPDIRPTALFTSFDSYAERIILTLQRMGLSVPEDISIVSFGGSWRASAMAEQISAVTVNEEVVGRQAVDALNDMVAGRKPIDQSWRSAINIDFFEGTSIAAPPQSASIPA